MMDVGVMAPRRPLMASRDIEPGFAHFDYVNPDAPVRAVMRASRRAGSFDNLNVVRRRGVRRRPRSGLGLV